MLPTPSRLRASADFSQAMRGRKSARRLIVAHLEKTSEDRPARVGFIVNSLVGNSVARHAVSRKLRHVAAHHLNRLPKGALLVVRALPGAAVATSADLERELDSALSELVA